MYRLDQLDTLKWNEIREIELAPQERVHLLDTRGLDITDIGEGVGPQQFLGHVFGAIQMLVSFTSRTVVVSRAPSAASTCGARTRLVTHANPAAVKKRRRLCVIELPSHHLFVLPVGKTNLGRSRRLSNGQHHAPTPFTRRVKKSPRPWPVRSRLNHQMSTAMRHPIPGASQFGRIKSLLARIKSLFDRLGNLPRGSAKINHLAARVCPGRPRNRIFPGIFPALREIRAPASPAPRPASVGGAARGPGVRRWACYRSTPSGR